MSRITDAGFPTGLIRLYRGEVGGSATGIMTPNQQYKEWETWAVPHGSYPSFLGFVGGKPEVVGGPLGGLVRLVPLRHPEYDWMLARDVNVSRFGYKSKFWRYHKVTVYFIDPRFDLSGQNAFVSIRTSPSQRTLEAPPHLFSVGGRAPTFDPHFEVDGTAISLTVHQLPSLDLATYAAYQRRVNTTAFWGYPAGTVKYIGPTTNRTNSVAGQSTYEIEHALEYSSIPWNYGFAADGSLSDVTYTGGIRRYPTADLNNLFPSG